MRFEWAPLARGPSFSPTPSPKYDTLGHMNATPSRAPIAPNIASFEKLRTEGYVYVDKTDLLYSILHSKEGQSFFISRPRRFGKSLMLSTLHAIFEGKRELFEGLKIASTDYDWPVYPVLHLDMSGITGRTPEQIRASLNNLAHSCARAFSFSIPIEENPAETFRHFWKQIAAQNTPIVVLVDEYDNPMQGFLRNPDMLEEVRQLMHNFYSCFKQYSANIRFLLMTGVSKFAKLSIFSGLNNLTDLTMRGEYASLLGYTHEELKTHFAEHLAAFAKHNGYSPEKAFDELLAWYDNYRFSPYRDIPVLNPVSVGSALITGELENYWIATGKSSLIHERILQEEMIPPDLEGTLIEKEDLDVCDAVTMPIYALLYQAGYLTIKGVDETKAIILGVPNTEVRTALAREYFNATLPTAKMRIRNARWNMSRLLAEGNLTEALECFRSAIAEFPYEWLMHDEGAVKIAFLMFFYPMRNAVLHPERQIANGRIDAILETPTGIYIFEFKYNRSAQEAFDQILQFGYHRPYLHKGKPVYGIGLNFNPANGLRGIDEPVVQTL